MKVIRAGATNTPIYSCVYVALISGAGLNGFPRSLARILLLKTSDRFASKCTRFKSLRKGTLLTFAIVTSEIPALHPREVALHALNLGFPTDGARESETHATGLSRYLFACYSRGLIMYCGWELQASRVTTWSCVPI